MANSTEKDKKFVPKAMKYMLTYIDGAGEYEDLNRSLWKMQESIRVIQNTVIREMYLSTTANEKFNATDA